MVLSFVDALDEAFSELLSRQGPRFSIRMVIGIFCSDTVFVQLNQFSQILSRQCCLLLSTKSNTEGTVSFPTELLENKSCGDRMAESPFLLTCCCRAVVMTEAVLIYPLPSMRCREGTSLLRTNLTNTRLLKTNSKMLTLPLALCR